MYRGAQRKIAQVVTAFLVEQWFVQQCCWTSNVVERTMLLIIVWTMLFIIVSTMLFIIGSTMLLNKQCCSLLFQQCCWTNNVVHYCFNNVAYLGIDEATTVVHGSVETGKSNIDRTSLVAIVIIVVTVLIVEQCCKNICVNSSTENKNSYKMLRMEIINGETLNYLSVFI